MNGDAKMRLAARLNLVGMVLALLAAMWLLIYAAGCESPERVAEAQAIVAEVQPLLDRLDAEEAELLAELASYPADDPQTAALRDRAMQAIERVRETRQRLQTAIVPALETMQDAQDGWDIAEAIGLGVAGFFPPAAIALPIIRRYRNAFRGTVASMAAGGGPKDPEAARRAMTHYAGLKPFVTAERVRIGDKVIEAVKPGE